MKSFWGFALTHWQRPSVEALALEIQQHHGPVVYFLLGAWLVQRGQAFDEVLLTAINQQVEPVEAQLNALRQQRKGVEGPTKQAILAQELALEKALYARLQALVPPTQGQGNRPWYLWWAKWFPRCEEAEFEHWRTTLGLVLK